MRAHGPRAPRCSAGGALAPRLRCYHVCSLDRHRGIVKGATRWSPSGGAAGPGAHVRVAVHWEAVPPGAAHYATSTSPSITSSRREAPWWLPPLGVSGGKKGLVRLFQSRWPGTTSPAANAPAGGRPDAGGTLTPLRERCSCSSAPRPRGALAGLCPLASGYGAKEADSRMVPHGSAGLRL